MDNTLLQDLACSPLFHGIVPEDLAALMQCFNPLVRRIPKGEIIITAGDPLHGIGVVIRGEIEIMHENAAGSRSLLAIAGQGKTFGEIAAFAGQDRWPSTVTARQDSVLVFIPPERFLGSCPRACGFHKTLIQNMLRILSQKALRLNRKVEYLEIKGIRPKLCTYLLEKRKANGADTFILPMSKSELADYLSVSRSSMSRELAGLRDAGVLDFYLSSVRLLDIQTITEIASS